MLKKFLPIAFFFLLFLPSFAQGATTTINPTSVSGSSEQHCFHHDVANVALIVNVGNLDDCVMLGAIERTSTGVNQVTANWNGPLPIGANVITYGATFNGLSGCTGSAWTVTASNGAVGSSATAHATVTMTSNDCAGYLELTASIPTTPVFVFRDEYSINIHTPELASYIYNCDSTGTQSDTQNPGLATCNTPSMRNYLCGSTTLTTEPLPASECTVPGLAAYTFQCGSTATTANAAQPATSTCNVPSSAVNNFNCGSGVSTAQSRNPSQSQCAAEAAPDGASTVVESGIRFIGPPAVMHIPDTGAAMTVPVSFIAYVPLGISPFPTAISVNVGPWASSCSLGLTSGSTAHSLGPDYDVWAVSGTVTIGSAQNTCEGRWEIQLTNGASVVSSADFSTFYIRDHQESQVRLCNASDFTTCTTPTVNTGGTVTVAPSGVQHLAIDSLPVVQVSQSGTWSIDNQNRLCNASTLGTACTTPTINADITGTLTVTNTGSQSITVSGTLDNLNRICAASPLGSTCTIATINTNTVSTFMGNSTQIVNFPGNLTVDLHSRGGLNTATGPGYDWWLELTFWILVFWYIMRNQNLFMLVFALGGVIHLVNSSWFFGLAQSLPWLALGALLDILMRSLRASKQRKEKGVKGAMN